MISIRRLLPVCLMLSALLVGALPAPAAAADLTIAEARSYMLSKINTIRANHGLQAVKVDSRVQDIAQTRSEDMAANHYFGHLSNSQLSAMFNARNISWSKIGEILAANGYPALDTSADVGMQGWRNSSTHWAIITDGAYNCAGMGVAKDTRSGNWIWTVEFVKVSAPTTIVAMPTVAFTSALVMPYSSTYKKVKVTWAGTPGTYAIKDFKLQYRINNGSWRTLCDWSTRSAKTIKVAKGKNVQFRVRARDLKLNRGTWTLSQSLAT